MSTGTQPTRTAKQTDKAKGSRQSDWPRSINPWANRGVIPWARRKLPFLKDELQHLADQFWNFAEDELFSGDIKPAADIAETSNGIVITMDVPGFEPDEIDVQVAKNTITIRGQRETCCCSEDEEVFLHRAERRCGKFSRTFALPSNVTGDANARCSNGVLTINLPKTDGLNARKVKVSS